MGQRDQIGEQPDCRGHGILALGIWDLYLGAFHHCSVEIRDNADEGFGTRQIQPDDVVTLAIDLENGRKVAAVRTGGGPGPELDDETLLDEVADDVGHGDAAEAQLSRQVGARQPAARGTRPATPVRGDGAGPRWGPDVRP